jgi:hypothetical protein
LEDTWDRVHRRIEEARETLRRGVTDPDRYFAERDGICLDAYESDGEWWCDLRTPGRERVISRYGRGMSAPDCKESAVRRWAIEQEGPDLTRRPGDSLP